MDHVDMPSVVPFRPLDTYLHRVAFGTSEDRTLIDQIMSTIGNAYDTMGTNLVAYNFLQHLYSQLVDNLGCEEKDYNNFQRGNVALIKRGTCFFAFKIGLAKKFGASAVILINVDDTLINASAGKDVAFVCFLVTSSIGAQLSNKKVFLYSKNLNENEETENFIIETIAGNPNNTIVVGAHADSVPEGHGVNDNGSGSSTILEIALQLYLKGIRPLNRIRFCWWAAEELGLLGSYDYVARLTPEDKKNIALNLNFDMLGSPNYMRGIYYGGAATVDPRIRTQSGNIQKVFEKHWNSLNLEFDLSPFDGRSDYGPFIETFIPAGGLAAGAEGIKTEEQRRKFGGITGIAFDVCYHKACDTVSNIHRLGIDEFCKAAANAVHFLGTLFDLKGYLNTPLPVTTTNVVELGTRKHIKL